MATNAIIEKVNSTDGGVNRIASTFYCTCSTAAGTAQKTATPADSCVFNDNCLITGVTVFVKFTKSNTHATPTLKVGTATAKGIMRYGTTKPGSLPNNSWHAGAVVLFTYDGTYWVMNDNNDGLEQSLTSSNWNLPLLLSYAGNTDTTTSIVNKSYRNNSIYANPSTGGIYCSQINGVTIPSTPDFTNTWRTIKVNGTQILGTGTNTGALNLVAGNEVALTNSSGSVTIDTAVNASVSGTDLRISRSVYDATDTVTQVNTTSSDFYRVLLSGTADDTTRTEGTRKSTNLTYNPEEDLLFLGNLTASGTITTGDIQFKTTNGGTTTYSHVLYDNGSGGIGIDDPLKKSLVNLIYPVGSIYISANGNPSTIFGGTWVDCGYSDPTNLLNEMSVTFDYGSFNTDGTDANGTSDKSTRVRTDNAIYLKAGTYTISTAFASFSSDTNYRIRHVMYAYDMTRTIDNNNSQKSWQNGPFTFTLTADRYVRFGFKYANDAGIAIRSLGYVKLVSGSSITDLPGNGVVTQVYKKWKRTA